MQYYDPPDSNQVIKPRVLLVDPQDSSYALSTQGELMVAAYAPSQANTCPTTQVILGYVVPGHPYYERNKHATQ